MRRIESEAFGISGLPQDVFFTGRLSVRTEIQRLASESKIIFTNRSML